MTEPILIGLAPAAITAFVAALANVLRLFGIADVTKDQTDAVNALALATITILGGIGAWWARRRATSLAAPKVPSGTTVTAYDPVDGAVTGTTTV